MESISPQEHISVLTDPLKRRTGYKRNWEWCTKQQGMWCVYMLQVSVYMSCRLVKCEEDRDQGRLRMK